MSNYVKNPYTQPWSNAHWVFNQNIQGIYDLNNQAPLDPNATFSNYTEQIGEIQALLKDLLSQNVRGHAMGAGWSFSKVATTDGYMVNPQALKTFFPLSPGHVVSGVNNSNLFLFQCGMSVHDVHMALAQSGKGLPVSGSSCGQSLIGAFTTGTHGSAFSGQPGTGAVQDAVRGLHIVVSPTRHVWLCPASNPIVTPNLTRNLGIADADVIQDDDLFNAALNSLGGFGVIHGTLLEATDAFRLDAYRYYTNFESLKNAITSFDFTGVDLGGAQPSALYHFEVMNNIYASNPDQAALVTVMTKTTSTANQITIPMNPAGVELVPLITSLTSAAPAAVPIAVNVFFNENYPPLNHVTGTLVDQNPYITNVGPGSIVCSLAMDMANCYQAMQICKTLNPPGTNIPVWYEFRFVPKVKGLLAFQKFDKTCVFEVAGFGSAQVIKYINDVLVELSANHIPFAFHWGKYMPIDAAQTKYGYPAGDNMQFVLDNNQLVKIYQDGAQDNVALWKAQRQKLFANDATLLNFFANEVMQKLGLA